MNGIPVNIIYKGKQYKCLLEEVLGAGGPSNTRWHLTENRYHCGSLSWSEIRGFWFGSNSWHDEEDEIGEQLERYVIAWYQ